MIPSEEIRRGLRVGGEVVFYFLLTLLVAASVTAVGLAVNQFLWVVSV